MIGAIIGDVAGSIYEFSSEKPLLKNIIRDECFFTDDSVLSVGVAVALIEMKLENTFGNAEKIFTYNLQKYGQLKNNYYQVFDSSGKKIKELYNGNVGELCGVGVDFMVFFKNSYYAIYDESGKKIKEIHDRQVGEFKNVTGTNINFMKNKYLCTYDKNFKKISERFVN